MNCRAWLILTLLIGQTCLAWGTDHPILRVVAKQDTLASTRIILDCTSTPKYQAKTSGQRVDLLLTNTSVAPSLRLLPEDDKIVKVLLAKRPEALLVSFLLRQVPERVTMTRDHGTSALLIDIFWQKNDSGRPAIAFRISGMPTPKKNGATASISNTSRFSKKWENFFLDYMSWPPLDVPPRLSHPQLPKLAAPDSTTAAAANLLRHAEDLIESGQAAEAATLLEHDQANRPPTALQTRFLYLKSLALADSGAPFKARVVLDGAKKQLVADKALGPFALLLMAELALVNNRPEQAARHLAGKNTVWPAKMRFLRNLRRADATAAAGKTTAAYRAYRRLGKLPSVLTGHPYSLGQAAQACLAHKAYRSAEKMFRLVADNSASQATTADALVSAAQAAWMRKGWVHATPLLRSVCDKFPEQEGALRARLKLIDIEMIAGQREQQLKLPQHYGRIAKRAKTRDLREEAAFKQALSVVIIGQHRQAIGMLQRFQRNFAAGPLCQEARALMADILPNVIDRLIDQGRNLEAVTMLEQHRELLVNSPWDKTFLPHLAEAMTRLGLFKRAARIYLYLLDGTTTAAGREPYFLPLVELLFEQQEYAAVEKYALRYQTRFPRGGDRAAIYLTRLKALRRTERTDRMATLLQSSKCPADPAIDLFGARFFWRRCNYAQTARFAGKLNKKNAGSAESRLLEAEALRLGGRLKQALPLYRKLGQGRQFAEQARFQQASILLRLDKRSEAINLLRQLAEKGEDLHWKQLARETLAVRRIL
jgi:tetratricopeptide (TPR) repeat protein